MPKPELESLPPAGALLEPLLDLPLLGAGAGCDINHCATRPHCVAPHDVQREHGAG